MNSYDTKTWAWEAQVNALKSELEVQATENMLLRAALRNVRDKRREMDMGDLSADEAVWEVDAIARAALEGKHD